MIFGRETATQIHEEEERCRAIHGCLLLYVIKKTRFFSMGSNSYNESVQYSCDTVTFYARTKRYILKRCAGCIG